MTELNFASLTRRKSFDLVNEFVPFGKLKNKNKNTAWTFDTRYCNIFYLPAPQTSERLTICNVINRCL